MTSLLCSYVRKGVKVHTDEIDAFQMQGYYILLTQGNASKRGIRSLDVRHRRMLG